MLSALLIGPENEPALELKEKLAGIENLCLSHHVANYPNQSEMRALLRQFSPDIALLNLADYQAACQSIGLLVELRPQLPIIAVHSFCDQQLLLEMIQMGVREIWFSPLQTEQMQQAANRLLRQIMATPHSPENNGALLAFLPARGGSGATTIAVNTAAALRKRMGPTLLFDFDFHNSVVAFWLKLDPKYGFRDAMEHSHRLDLSLWKSMVSSVRDLEVLSVPQNSSPMAFTSAQTHAVLDFARQNYQYVFADLPDAIYSSCWDVLEHATYILLVATPEMPSLYLARRKLEQLQNHGISKDVMRVLLNRSAQLDVQPAEVQKFLNLPVMATFCNDYRTVKAAVADGRFVPEGSKLGAQFVHFAHLLAGGPKIQEAKTTGWKIRRIFSPA